MPYVHALSQISDPSQYDFARRRYNRHGAGCDQSIEHGNQTACNLSFDPSKDFGDEDVGVGLGVDMGLFLIPRLVCFSFLQLLFIPVDFEIASSIDFPTGVVGLNRAGFPRVYSPAVEY